MQKIPVIISAYKSAVSREINKNIKDISFTWQASYYDRLIRNEEEFDAISVYIVKNPLNWKNDIEYKDYFSKSEILLKKSEIHSYYEKIVNKKFKDIP